MKIFLAGIIQGSIVEPAIHAQLWRDPIKAVIARYYPQAQVYCHYTAHPNSITYEMDAIEATFSDGISRAASADLLVAYLPSASMGTGIEMYAAAEAGVPVVSITPLAANWVVRVCSDVILPDMEAFEQFCASGGLERLIADKRK